EEVVDVAADPLRVRRVRRVLGVDEGADAAPALRVGDPVVDESRLARGLRAEDLDDAAARQAADPEREIERERARRDGADRDRGAVVHLHDRPLAELPLDLAERYVECFVLVHLSLLKQQIPRLRTAPRRGAAGIGKQLRRTEQTFPPPAARAGAADAAGSDARSSARP